MTNIGHLCIISDDLERAGILKTAFEKARYKVDLYRSADGAASQLATLQPDVVLVSNTLRGLSVQDLATQLRSDSATAHIPIAIDAAKAEDFSTWQQDNSSLPIANDVLPQGLDPETAVFRLQPLFRLSTMTSELLLRHSGTAETALPFADSLSMETSRCFYLSLNPTLRLPSSIFTPDMVWETAASISEADTLITGPGFFDVAVIDATPKDVDDIIQFCRDMRDNPRLFNLPFLIRIPNLHADDIQDLYRVGANRVLTSADSGDTLRYEALSLIKLQISRNHVRETLRRTLTEHTGHPLESVYTEAFLQTYLDKRIDLAVSRKRALSVVHLHLPEALSLMEEAGEAACQMLSEQLGRWLSRLVRVEDLAARVDYSNFVVVLPDTLPHEAQYVMNRIAGVLSFTDFAIHDVFHPVKVWPLIGVSGLEEKDDASCMLSRAKENLS